jgi:hypothetical protein
MEAIFAPKRRLTLSDYTVQETEHFRKQRVIILICLCILLRVYQPILLRTEVSILIERVINLSHM